MAPVHLPFFEILEFLNSFEFSKILVKKDIFWSKKQLCGFLVSIDKMRVFDEFWFLVFVSIARDLQLSKLITNSRKYSAFEISTKKAERNLHILAFYTFSKSTAKMEQ